ncbi:Deoxyhypusine hydroxylase [Capsicum baccatum]|uniref:Deoxyhypusine hydroxylase n=1 Tax=Capsicum baccatum TaxID=33114 RepID=A0A2G2W0R6_CAPBA|nr:Deoxyhypusine hydroxylase [Capsicum baccatum]
MYKHYAALFALRNNGGEETISATIESLGLKSALLRHEVAYSSKSTNNVVVVQGGDGGQGREKSRGGAQGWEWLVDVVVVMVGEGRWKRGWLDVMVVVLGRGDSGAG